MSLGALVVMQLVCNKGIGKCIRFINHCVTISFKGYIPGDKGGGRVIR